MPPVLRAEGLGKMFLHRGRHPATFRGFVEGGWRQMRASEWFWALRDVSFSVAPGEMLGVIGHNGSGKSTLLRLLGGVMRADEGALETRAPVNGLLDLNTGMHLDLSGRENVHISGVLAGLLRSEVRDRFDDIVAFAELDAFIDEPVRTYSAGMRLRLGFAIAVHVHPRILLIDEVLAVGDVAFQRKCIDRIRRFKEDGCAIVFITHDMSQIAQVCDRAMWMDHGRVRAIGTPSEIVSAYQSAMLDASRALTRQDATATTTFQGRPLIAGENRIGSGEVTVENLRLLGRDGVLSARIAPGQGLIVQARIALQKAVTSAYFSVTISDAAGAVCFDTNTQVDDIALPPLRGGEAIELEFERLDLAPGTYSISVGLWHADWTHAYDYHIGAYVLEVEGGIATKGMIAPPRRWKIHPASDAGVMSR